MNTMPQPWVGTLPSPIKILLVEDSEPDILLTQEAFAEAGILNDMHVARDGVEALEYLGGLEPTGLGSSTPTDAAGTTRRPDLILLDINMPRMNGLELLQRLKRHPELKSIPVIMLTTSATEEDILRSYRAQAASYVVKPLEFSQFFQAIQALGKYMLTIVRVPGSGPDWPER